MILNLAICDDNSTIHDSLTDYISRFHLLHDTDLHATHYYSGDDLQNAYRNGDTFDLVIMDIELPGANGIDIIYQIQRELHCRITTIFLTGHPHYMRNSFSVHPYNFLDKPLEYEVFEKQIVSFLEQLAGDIDRLALLDISGNTHFVSVKDIFYIEGGRKYAYKNQIVFFTQNEMYHLRNRLSNLPDILKYHIFYQTNRGTYVNMLHISYLESETSTIVLTNGARLKFTKRKLNDFKLRYNHFLLNEWI